MNWDAIAAITSALAFCAILVGGAIAYGKLTQAVDNVGRLLEKHDQTIDEHETRLSHMEGGLARAGFSD